MIEVPDAVRDYLTQDDIRTAVDALIGGKHEVPDGLEWGEVGAYYGAVGAAVYTKSAFAITVARLWEAVWHEYIGEFPAATSDEQADYTTPLSVDECWEEQGFTRCFRLGPKSWLWACLGLDKDDVSVSTRISKRSGKSLLSLLDGFEAADAKDWVYLSAGKLLDGDDPLPQLRDAARRIVEVARSGSAT